MYELQKLKIYKILKGQLKKKKVIIDVSGIVLTPGNCGRDCLGNGEHYDKKNRLIECCCNECDFAVCCLESHNDSECINCNIIQCPRAEKAKN